eukprot:5897413-Lingulodinium_polyedra.AAC.1
MRPKGGRAGSGANRTRRGASLVGRAPGAWQAMLRRWRSPPDGAWGAARGRGSSGAGRASRQW